MSLRPAQKGIVWEVPGIGSFNSIDLRNTLVISESYERLARNRFSQTKSLPPLLEDLLWLMLDNRTSVQKAALFVECDKNNHSVRILRNKLLGISAREFAILIGLTTKQVYRLEQEEAKSGEGKTSHRHLLSIILRMLSVREFQADTVSRLLYLAKFRAKNQNQLEAVSRLSKLLILPNPLPPK